LGCPATESIGTGCPYGIHSLRMSTSNHYLYAIEKNYWYTVDYFIKKHAKKPLE